MSENDVNEPRYAELLNKLAYDDEFRARMESDPQGVLADHNIEFEESRIPSPVELPAKEDLQQHLDEHVTTLEVEGFFGPMPVFVEPEPE